MTRDHDFKLRVRDRARRTGESYSTARSNLVRRRASADADLVARSIRSVLQRLRNAEPAKRRTAVAGLTRDQGSLYAFWILFTHADDGLTGFCRSHPHRLVDRDFWTLLEVGLLEHPGLIEVIARLRIEVDRARQATADRGACEWLEALDVDVMRRSDSDFAAAIPASLRRMADRIRVHPERFRVRGEVAL